MNTDARQGCFLWPQDDETREQALGSSFEALDPIRVEQMCYITFNSTNSVLTVCGSSRESVRLALIRIRATYFQIRALNVEADTTYIVKPLGRENLNVEVELLAPVDVDDNITPFVHPRIWRHEEQPPEDERTKHQNDEIVTEDQNGSKIKRLILKTLSKTEYYRGHLRFRVRLGRFVLTSYKKADSYPLEDFVEMMENPQVVGQVMQEFVHTKTKTCRC